MDNLVFHLDERLAHVGDTLSHAGHVDQSSYSLGDREFLLPSGYDFDLTLTNADEGIFVSGIVRAHVSASCDRCLCDTSFDIAAEIGEYYLFEEPEDADDIDDETEYLLVSPTHDLDLAQATEAALSFETPFVVLCKEDCKGLCPHCGANLNEGDCGCAQEISDEEKKNSPFAVLSELGSQDKSSDS